MTDLQPGADPRSCFGSVADAYDRGRPSYPTQAAAWLVGEQPATVLELGAGTGKLTEVLVGLHMLGAAILSALTTAALLRVRHP